MCLAHTVHTAAIASLVESGGEFRVKIIAQTGITEDDPPLSRELGAGPVGGGIRGGGLDSSEGGIRGALIGRGGQNETFYL